MSRQFRSGPVCGVSRSRAAFSLATVEALSNLRDGAEHLANEHCGRRVLGEMVGRAGRNQGHAEAPRMIVTGELHSLAKFAAMRRGRGFELRIT